jgi:hypothetical protein
MHRRSRRLSGPGNFIFRTGEFEQWNGVLFEPATAPELAQYWIDILLRWYIDLVIDADDLSLRERPKDKLVAPLRPQRRHRVQVRLVR